MLRQLIAQRGGAMRRQFGDQLIGQRFGAVGCFAVILAVRSGPGLRLALGLNKDTLDLSSFAPSHLQRISR